MTSILVSAALSPISMESAVARTVSWRAASSGVSPASIDAAEVVHLRRSTEAMIVDAVKKGVIKEDSTHGSGDHLDRAAFHAWLLRQPGDVLEPRTFDSARRDLHPAEAVAWIACGELLRREQVLAHLALAAHVRGVLADHAHGIALLEGYALKLAHALSRELAAFEVAFEAARAKLQIDIVTLVVEAYAADHGRSLCSADFANSLWLDALAGEFLPIGAPLLSPEWARARAAGDRIGAVRICAQDLKNRYHRRHGTAAARKRGAAALRALFEQWRRGQGALPKRVDWVNGAGLEIVGSVHGAGKVWDEMTADPAYAEARKPGRRPKITKA